MSTVLSAEHQELVALLLALQRLQATHRLTDAEMSLWMGDTVDTGHLQSPLLQSADDVRPHWLSQQVLSGVVAAGGQAGNRPLKFQPVGKFSFCLKHNFGLKIPIWRGGFRGKTKFRAHIIFSAGNLQLLVGKL